MGIGVKIVDEGEYKYFFVDEEQYDFVDANLVFFC